MSTDFERMQFPGKNNNGLDEVSDDVVYNELIANAQLKINKPFMTPKNQITILKALKAIEGLSNSTAITTLLNSDAGFNSIIGDVITMKYKLSIIEQLINEIKAENQTSSPTEA